MVLTICCLCLGDYCAGAIFGVVGLDLDRRQKHILGLLEVVLAGDLAYWDVVTSLEDGAEGWSGCEEEGGEGELHFVVKV